MSVRKKIAIILSRFPFPLDKGDKLRAFHQIKYISQFYDVALFALSADRVLKNELEALNPYCVKIKVYPLNKFQAIWQALRSIGRKWPVQVGYFYQPNLKLKMQADIQQWQPDVVYCQLARTALYAKDLPYRKVIDFQDAFSLNYNRIQKQSRGLHKLFYKRESLSMKQFEIQMCSWFDEACIISAFDKEQIAVRPNKLCVVPNGVDLLYFTKNSANKTTDILFSGNLSYLPNKKAVLYLLEEIAPELIRRLPAVRIKIVGASAEDFKHFASENICIHGWYNDIRDAYNETHLFVVPLFTGAGLQNKLLEAMSMEVPCITTSIVNASLGANENEHLLIADDKEKFVEHILRLLKDVAFQQMLQKNARAFIEQHYSWEQANEKLMVLFKPN